MRLSLASGSSLVWNVVSNYATVVWLAVLSIVTVPIYVAALGRPGWGVVAASMALQMIFSFLDAGLSQIMPRWLALAANDRRQSSKYYHVFFLLFATVGLLGFVLGQSLAGFLSREWFNAGSGGSDQLELGLRIVLFQFLFQFANSANIGYWNGVQQQALANFRQCGFATLKHASALATIFFFACSPISYLVAFAVVSALELTANRHSVIKGLGDVPGARDVSKNDIREIGSQAVGFAAGVLVGTAVTNLDRIVLSATENITSFGTYVIVANLAVAFFQLQAPLTRAFLPRIVRERTQHAGEAAGSTRRLFFAMCLFCVLPCLITALWAPEILRLWLRNEAIVEEGALPLRLLVLAVAVNSIYNVIYQLIIAAGRSSVPLMTNVAALCAGLVAILAFGSQRGIVLGGIIWIVTSLTQACAGIGWFLLYEKPRTMPRNH